MNLIQKIGLAGVGPFQKEVFQVPKGVTYVYGKNMATGSGNAVGKSLFFSSPAEMFYDPLIGTKQDKVKAGSRFIQFRRGKREVLVRSKFQGRSERLELLVDGKHKTGRVNSNTRDSLSGVWPIAENEYKTYGYLDSSISHPLARGTTTERKAFFTSFFGLDSLDRERKLIKAELDKIKKVKAAYNELNTTFLEIKKDMLPKQERESIEARVANLESRVSQMRERYELFQRNASLLEFEQVAGDSIKRIKDVDTFEADYASLKRQIRLIEDSQDQLAEWEGYRRDLARYREQTEGMDLTISMEVLEKSSKLYVKAKSRIEDGAPSEPSKPEKVLKPDVPRDQLVADLSNLRHQIEHSEKFGSGSCPTCGQKVRAEPIEKLKRRRSDLADTIAAWDRYESYARKLERYKEDLASYQEEHAAFQQAEVHAKKHRENHLLYQKRRNLVKPKKVDKPEVIADAENIKRLHAAYEFCAPHIEKIKELGSIDRGLSFDVDRMNKMQDEVSSLRAKLEVHNAVKSRASKMRDRLRSLEEQMNDEAALQLLLDGYSDKNVKRRIIESISAHLMTAVNYYAQFVFDGYKFEFVWGTQIQLLVHRPKIGTSDVRKLSNAESKVFTLILVLSLLKFVPASKRLSMIVMDEPTASFHAKTIEQFHTLLPHLNQIIPSIIVVTPKQDERFEGANEVTVVRGLDGYSKIMKGHPDEIHLGNG